MFGRGAEPMEIVCGWAAPANHGSLQWGLLVLIHEIKFKLGTAQLTIRRGLIIIYAYSHYKSRWMVGERWTGPVGCLDMDLG